MTWPTAVIPTYLRLLQMHISYATAKKMFQTIHVTFFRANLPASILKLDKELLSEDAVFP